MKQQKRISCRLAVFSFCTLGCRFGATVGYFVELAEKFSPWTKLLLKNFKLRFLASKICWKIQVCLRDPVSSTVLPTSAKDELFRKFTVLPEAWRVCSWYLSLSFSQNEQAFEEVFQNANFNTYEFRIRVKQETYNVSVPQKANNVVCVFCSFTCLHRRWLPPLIFLGRSFQRYLLTQILSVLSTEGGIHCC